MATNSKCLYIFDVQKNCRQLKALVLRSFDSVFSTVSFINNYIVLLLYIPIHR